MTNFVLFRLDPGLDRAAFLSALESRGVLLVPYLHGQIRAVTHHGIEAADVDLALDAIRAVLRDLLRVGDAGASAGAPASVA